MFNALCFFFFKVWRGMTLFVHLQGSRIFSKFDLKAGFWQLRFIDTGADTSMIDPYVFPSDYWEPQSGRLDWQLDQFSFRVVGEFGSEHWNF